jgi:energy-coupling factor transporter ATP-binding protein EcfA2
MKIIAVSVSNLFGMFDHHIPLNTKEGVTIIHGSNGLGKTAILRMINGLFNGRYSELKSIPFKSFDVEFDDGSKIRISRPSAHLKGEVKPEHEQSALVAEYYPEPGAMPQATELGASWKREDVSAVLRYLEQSVPLERVGGDQWVSNATGELLSSEEALEQYWEYLPKQIVKEMGMPLFARSPALRPGWFEDIRSQINVRFIKTQRLVSIPAVARRSRHEPFSQLTPAVAAYAAELAGIIQKKFSEYASLSQSLDQTFPRRVISRDATTTLPLEALSSTMNKLEQKRDRLREAGLLEREPHYFGGVPTSIDDVTRSVLSVYAVDMGKKLDIFNDVADKVELLKQFVKDHFLYKELVISKEKGFTLRSTKTGEALDPTQLSSGEQHELVLLYELLFRVKPGSLILIDEPEISLHIDWQTQFLADLANVIRLSPFDALIATHSPQIVNDRWDLTVELEAR